MGFISKQACIGAEREHSWQGTSKNLIFKNVIRGHQMKRIHMKTSVAAATTGLALKEKFKLIWMWLYPQHELWIDYQTNTVPCWERHQIFTDFEAYGDPENLSLCTCGTLSIDVVVCQNSQLRWTQPNTIPILWHSVQTTYRNEEFNSVFQGLMGHNYAPAVV